MRKRVLLVNMPFGGVDRPPVGISTLAAALARRDLECDVRYFNFTLAEWLGPEAYQWMSDRASHMVFAGEWVFARELWGDLLPPEHEYIEHIQRDLRVDAGTVQMILQMRGYIRPFLDYCLYNVRWDDYGIVGFTSTFEQNLASLALAHALKSRYPHITIVMGGANCEGSMGAALHRCFPCLDFVFTGQSDTTFPEFVSRMFRGENWTDIPGIVGRGADGRSIVTGPAAQIWDMDALPIPDYDAYISQITQTSIPRKLPIRLQIETSRGCWWGAKQHCTFCGFLGESMPFRSKSADRVLAELRHLTARYGVLGVDAVDSIFDARYYRDLLPALRDADLGVNLFYELKANVNRDQVRLLSEAGVKAVQPGIESFSRRVLRLMRKGTTPLQNVQLLKWCAEFGIRPSFNILYGFPREHPDDYAEMLELMRSLSHLPPPHGSGRLRLDRFSPHYDQAPEFGIRDVKPLAVYRHLYPVKDSELREIAYFFDYDYDVRPRFEAYEDELQLEIAKWRANAEAKLEATDDGELVRIVDTRTGSPGTLWMLAGWRADIYRHCDHARPRQWLRDTGRLQVAGDPPSVDELQEFIDACVEERLMARDEDHYLSLAVFTSSSGPKSTAREETVAICA